jgi:beta-glucanase (GH16 family)
MTNHILQVSFFLAANLVAFSACTQPAQKPQVPVSYVFTEKPVWQDEFEYSGKPDPKKWSYDLGGDGWGNNELENYTDKPENARIENGNLIIEARNEKSGKQNYSSARLVTKGKGDFLYGKFEIRAKLPEGKGTWPAIWMLGTNETYGNKGWPDNGEIDIMEHVGFDQDNVHGNVHTKAFNHVIHTNKGDEIVVKNASTAFHIYACEWTPEYVSMLVDGREYFRFRKETGFSWEQWPFDKPFHLLLNVAIGGNWGGQKGVDDSIFPQKMEVDYVRVYGLVKKK